MATTQRGLGRGLGALIPTSAPDQGTTDPTDAQPGPQAQLDRGASAGALAGADLEQLAEVPGLTLVEIATDQVAPNPRQPREVFDPEGLAELAYSIQEIGFLQPIVVRPGGSPDHYEIVAGERRWRAAQLAGLTSVPALVRLTPDQDLLRDALLENLHRVQLNPLEEAAAYQQLLTDFDCTQEQLAARLGRSRPAVSNALRLLRLPAPVQRRVAAGVLSAGHARALASLTDEAAMEALATRIVAEGLSVRAVEEIVAMGDLPATARRKQRSPRPGSFTDLATDLGDRLETRVKISGSTGRGRIAIDFASPDDLQRIMTALRDPQTWR